VVLLSEVHDVGALIAVCTSAIDWDTSSNDAFCTALLLKYHNIHCVMQQCIVTSAALDNIPCC